MNSKSWITIFIVLALGGAVAAYLYAFPPVGNQGLITPPVTTPTSSLPAIPTPQISYSEVIPTAYGDMTLSYSSGTATLSGTLNRSTPCINWKISSTSTKDMPPSRVGFTVTSVSTADVCVQVLGQPQPVTLSVPAGEKTTYTVKVRDSIVFSSQLNSPVPQGS